MAKPLGRFAPTLFNSVGDIASKLAELGSIASSAQWAIGGVSVIMAGAYFYNWVSIQTILARLSAIGERTSKLLLDLTALGRNVTAARRDVAAVQVEVAAAGAAIVNLRNDATQIIAGNQELNEKLTDVQNMVIERTDAVQIAITDVHNRVTTAGQEVATELNNVNLRLTQTTSEISALTEGTTNGISGLTFDLNLVREKLDAAQTSLQGEISDTRFNVRTLDGKLTTTAAAQSDLLKQAVEATSGIGGISQQIDQLSAKVDAAALSRPGVSAMGRQLEEFTKIAQEAHAAQLTLSTELKTSMKSSQLLTNKVNQLQESQGNLKSEFLGLKLDLQTSTQQMSANLSANLLTQLDTRFQAQLQDFKAALFLLRAQKEVKIPSVDNAAGAQGDILRRKSASWGDSYLADMPSSSSMISPNKAEVPKEAASLAKASSSHSKAAVKQPTTREAAEEQSIAKAAANLSTESALAGSSHVEESILDNTIDMAKKAVNVIIRTL